MYVRMYVCTHIHTHIHTHIGEDPWRATAAAHRPPGSGAHDLDLTDFRDYAEMPGPLAWSQAGGGGGGGGRTGESGSGDRLYTNGHGPWFSSTQPRVPAQVALPAHLLPGAVHSESEELEQEQECCVCFAARQTFSKVLGLFMIAPSYSKHTGALTFENFARQTATLLPCGHKLCRGCALFLKDNGALCPMCRRVISAVS
jgi:hypothetical protein